MAAVRAFEDLNRLGFGTCLERLTEAVTAPSSFYLRSSEITTPLRLRSFGSQCKDVSYDIENTNMTLFSFQKKFAQYLSHRIFGHMHEVLNAVEKITNYPV